MKYTLLGLLVFLPLVAGARAPLSTELWQLYSNTGGGSSNIKATSTGEVHYVTSYATTQSGFKIGCDGQTIYSIAVAGQGTFPSPLKCAGSLQELGDGELSASGYTMTEAEFDEQPSSGGGSTGAWNVNICTKRVI